MPSPVINKVITPDFNGMTIPQLKAEAFRLAGVLDLVNSQRLTIRLLIERRQAEARATQRIANMDAIEKDALREALGN